MSLSVGVAVASLSGGASAMDLVEAVRLVVETHPEINKASSNKQAIEFELDQARGRYLPSVDLEVRGGVGARDGSSSSARDAEHNPLFGAEGRATLTQMVFDGGAVDSDVEMQGYRIDGAASRVRERSEFLGLEGARVYIDFLRVQSLVGLAEDNLSYHRGKLAEIRQGADSGVLSEADLQQARERVLSAENSLTLAQLDLENGRIAFIDVVGMPPEGLGDPAALNHLLPASLEAALGDARQANPRIDFAQSDIGASEAMYRGSNAPFLPQVSLEAYARTGKDVAFEHGTNREAWAGVVVRYNLNGGIDTANRQEQLRRVSESRSALHEQVRFVEKEVRISWAQLESERRRLPLLESELASSRRLLDLYQREFDVGQRTLLDLLNTRNAVYQAEIDLASGRYVELYAQYRVLGSMGTLLASLGVQPPVDSVAYAAQNTGAPAVGTHDNEPRTDPWTPTSGLFGGKQVEP
ncbi:MAG: TolC family outer membrane protein [Pikeienuella sp.]